MPIKWKISRTLDKGMQSWITHIFLVCVSKGWMWMSTHKKMMIPRRSKDYWATEIVSHNTHTSVVKLSTCNFPFTLDIQSRCTSNCRADTRLRRWSRVRNFQERIFWSKKNSQFLEISFVNLQRNSFFLSFRGLNLAWSKTAVVVDARLSTCLKLKSLCAPHWHCF